MLHSIHAQGTKANLLVRGAILALGVSLALCLWLLVAPSQEARAQGNTPPSVERDSPSSSSVSLETGDTQTFTATGTGEATYLGSWEFFINGSSEGGQSLSSTLSHQASFTLLFNSAGTHTIKISFTDLADTTGSTTWRVTVTDPQSNEAPRITSSSPSRRITVEEDDRETFSFTATDDDNNINEWSYYVDGKLEGGQSLSLTGSISTSFTHEFTRDGVFDVELEVTDSDGETDDYEWEVTVEEENSEPRVNKVSPLSTPRLRPGDSETFEAEATDRDDNISQVEWTVDGRSVSGQSLSLTGSIERSYTHVFSSAGTVDVEVEFTDQAGGSDSVSWTVYVETEDTNRPPRASHVSPSASLALDIGDTQTFTASATDPDSNISQIQWFVNGQSVSGQSLSLTGSIERSHTHTFSGGTYEIEARVTDSDGLSDSVIWELSAGDPPVIGRLGCSPTRVEEGVSVSCTPQTRGGSVSTYQWGASGGIPPSGSSGAFSTHWNSSGTKRVSLRVCNSDGCDSEEQNITVVDSGDANTEERRFVPSPVQINQPPLVSPVSPLSSVVLDVGDSQTFTAKAKDADDNITSIEWLVNGVTEDRESFGRSSPVEKSFTYIATSAGHYEVRAVFTDSDGASGYMEWEFEAIDPKPQINGLGCAPVSLEVGESFACSPSLSGSAPARYNWTANGAVPTVGYSREFSATWDTAGQKQVALEVCDAQGNCDSTTQTVPVLPPTPPPQIDSLGCYTPGLNIDWQLLCRPQLSGGPAVSFSWTARGAFPPGSRNETFAIMSWNAPGNREVSLEVCNRRGECETLSQSVTIGGTAQSPQIDSLGCTPGTVEVAEEVACTPSLSGGPAERFNWSAEDAAPWLGYGAEFSTRWNSPRRKVIELEVCDAEELCDTGQQAIAVEGAPGAPPVIHNLGCSASVVEVGEYITCNPEFSADGPVEYIWEATGSFPDYGDARGFRTRLAYAGTEVITLLLCTDDECDYSVHNVEVVDEVTDNRPPVATIVSPSSPVTVRVDDHITFTAQASDPDGSLSLLGWVVTGTLGLPIRSGFSPITTPTQGLGIRFPSPGFYTVSVIYYDRDWEKSIVQWEVTATQAPTVIGSQDTFDGALSGTNGAELFLVYASEDRFLRMALNGPPNADFDLYARLSESESGGWQLLSENPGSQESIQIANTVAGWYELLVTSRRGGGAFTLLTRTDEVHLDITFTSSTLRRNQPKIQVEISKDCGLFDPLPLIEPDRWIAGSRATSKISIDLTGFAIRNPECYLDYESEKGWRIKLKGVQGHRLDEVSVRLVYDDFEWVLTALELPNELLGDEVTIWVPLEDEHKLLEAAEFVANFIILDDINTLRSPEASFASKALAAGLIGLNFIPPAKVPALLGRTGFVGIKVAIKYGKPAVKSVDDVVSLGQIDKAIKKADVPSFRNTIITSKAVANVHSRILGMSGNIAKRSPKSLDDFFWVDSNKAVDEFSKVSHLRIGHKGKKLTAREYWDQIIADLGAGKTLDGPQAGFYQELKVAAAAKSIGMKLPDNWLRKGFGPAGRQVTDLDVLAEYDGVRVAFDVKADWLKHSRDTEIGKVLSGIDNFAKAADEESVQLAVAIGKRVPDSSALVRMADHGIEYVEWID